MGTRSRLHWRFFSRSVIFFLVSLRLSLAVLGNQAERRLRVFLAHLNDGAADIGEGVLGEGEWGEIALDAR